MKINEKSIIIITIILLNVAVECKGMLKKKLSRDTESQRERDNDRDSKTERERQQDREAHLTVAIRRQEYSIALTKSFQNTFELQEERNKRGGGI